MYVHHVQMTLRQCPVRRRRRVSAAHLAGSCILTRTHSELDCFGQRQHRINASTRVLQTLAAMQSNGAKSAPDGAVICMTVNFLVSRTMLQHCSKSSDAVMQNQMSDTVGVVNGKN